MGEGSGSGSPFFPSGRGFWGDGKKVLTVNQLNLLEKLLELSRSKLNRARALKME